MFHFHDQIFKIKSYIYKQARRVYAFIVNGHMKMAIKHVTINFVKNLSTI